MKEKSYSHNSKDEDVGMSFRRQLWMTDIKIEEVSDWVDPGETKLEKSRGLYELLSINNTVSRRVESLHNRADDL